MVGEVVLVIGTGATSGTTHDTEGTLGFARKVNHDAKFEAGYTLKGDMRDQYITAWE